MSSSSVEDQRAAVDIENLRVLPLKRLELGPHRCFRFRWLSILRPVPQSSTFEVAKCSDDGWALVVPVTVQHCTVVGVQIDGGADKFPLHLIGEVIFEPSA